MNKVEAIVVSLVLNLIKKEVIGYLNYIKNSHRLPAGRDARFFYILYRIEEKKEHNGQRR